MSGNIAGRYAKAILELGNESGSLESLVAEISELARIYSSHSELRTTLESPLVTHAAKQAIISELVVATKASTLAKNTLLLLSNRRRLSLLGSIGETLRSLHDAQRGIVHAHVTTATPLDDAQYTKLQEQLETMTGKRVMIERHEDCSLLGGIVTRIGDRMIDGSIKGRLEAMRRELMPS